METTIGDAEWQYILNMLPSDLEQSAADKKVLHLRQPVIEDMAFPVGMETLTGVGMFVKMSTVEEAEAVFIIRKVRWHPV